MVYEYFVNYFQIFLMVFIRILGLFISAPFYSGAAMPMRFKLPFAFFISLLAAPLVIGMGVKAPADLVDFGVRMISGFVFGAGVGIFVYMIVSAFQVSAQIFSIQMGLGMNEVFDPISDTQVPAIGNVLGILIILLLLRVDGQFYMIQMIIDSFQKVDLITVSTAGMLLKGLLSAVIAMFEIGLKISLPIIGITLLMDVAMGIISRVAPQFNVMIMGFNIKLLVGFGALWLILPAVIDLGGSVIKHMIQNVNDWIGFMKPG
jgi:flagellar biosynthesis protein FliR